MDRLNTLALVLAQLRSQAQTVDELCSHLGRDHRTVHQAIRRLRASGQVVNSGMNRLTRRSRPAVVWRAVDGPAPDAHAETMGIMPALRWRCK